MQSHDEKTRQLGNILENSERLKISYIHLKNVLPWPSPFQKPVKLSSGLRVFTSDVPDMEVVPTDSSDELGQQNPV